MITHQTWYGEVQWVPGTPSLKMRTPPSAWVQLHSDIPGNTGQANALPLKRQNPYWDRGQSSHSIEWQADVNCRVEYMSLWSREEGGRFILSGKMNRTVDLKAGDLFVMASGDLKMDGAQLSDYAVTGHPMIKSSFAWLLI